MIYNLSFFLSLLLSSFYTFFSFVLILHPSIKPFLGFSLLFQINNCNFATWFFSPPQSCKKCMQLKNARRRKQGYAFPSVCVTIMRKRKARNQDVRKN